MINARKIYWKIFVIVWPVIINLLMYWLEGRRNKRNTVEQMKQNATKEQEEKNKKLCEFLTELLSECVRNEGSYVGNKTNPFKIDSLVKAIEVEEFKSDPNFIKKAKDAIKMVNKVNATNHRQPARVWPLMKDLVKYINDEMLPSFKKN